MTTLADLRALADAATPGPWHSVLPGDVAWAHRHKYRCVAFGKRDSDYTTCPLQPPDARYIAACSPEVIKALVAVAEAAGWWGEFMSFIGPPHTAHDQKLLDAIDTLRAVLDA